MLTVHERWFNGSSRGYIEQGARANVCTGSVQFDESTRAHHAPVSAVDISIRFCLMTALTPVLRLACPLESCEEGYSEIANYGPCFRLAIPKGSDTVTWQRRGAAAHQRRKDMPESILISVGSATGILVSCQRRICDHDLAWYDSRGYDDERAAGEPCCVVQIWHPLSFRSFLRS